MTNKNASQLREAWDLLPRGLPIVVSDIHRLNCSDSRSEFLINMLLQGLKADVLNILRKRDTRKGDIIKSHAIFDLISQISLQVQIHLKSCMQIRDRVLLPYRPVSEIFRSILFNELFFNRESLIFSNVFLHLAPDNLLTSIPNPTDNLTFSITSAPSCFLLMEIYAITRPF